MEYSEKENPQEEDFETYIDDDDIIFLEDAEILTGTFRATFGNDLEECVQKVTAAVGECELPPIGIPNAVTPNDDAENDVFWIRNIWHYPLNTLRIYNRWGNLVFEADGYNNTWDGTRNGRDLPDATYYYVLDLGNGDATYKGTVTVFR